MPPRNLGVIAATALAAVLAVSCSTAPRGPAAVLDKVNRASEYTTFGNQAFQDGDLERATTFFQQALAVNLSLDNEGGVIQSLGSLGKVRLAGGDTTGATELLERAHRLSATLDDPAIRLQTAVSLAELSLRLDDAEGARRRLVAEPLEDKRLAGTQALAIYYHTLAVAERKLDALADAEAHLSMALAINRKLAASRETASNLIVLASIHTATGDIERARTEAVEALELDKLVENTLGIAQDLVALGHVTRRLGRHAESFRYFERAYGVYDALALVNGRLAVLAVLPEAARLAGLDVEAAGYERLLAESATP